MDLRSSIWEFQFPSNGKAYLNHHKCGWWTRKQLEFQFPSNGKAYLNRGRWTDGIWPADVSIPFKRESVSEPIVTCLEGSANGLEEKFQFPSNGKAYLNIFMCHVLEPLLNKSFNSLQTGKRIWTVISEPTEATLATRVSIPFKRESVSERSLSPPRRSRRSSVSIPFKRESVSEQEDPPYMAELWARRFQFPSNGKAYLNIWRHHVPRRPDAEVSIPFKRESVSELIQAPCQTSITTVSRSFNSLQTGKRIWTLLNSSLNRTKN